MQDKYNRKTEMKTENTTTRPCLTRTPRENLKKKQISSNEAEETRKNPPSKTYLHLSRRRSRLHQLPNSSLKKKDKKVPDIIIIAKATPTY